MDNFLLLLVGQDLPSLVTIPTTQNLNASIIIQRTRKKLNDSQKWSKILDHQGYSVEHRPTSFFFLSFFSCRWACSRRLLFLDTDTNRSMSLEVSCSV